MKYKCPEHEHGYRCHNSEEYYSVERSHMFGNVCSSDPYFYQACNTTLSGFRVTNNKQLCYNWLCKASGSGGRIFSLTRLKIHECDGAKHCENSIDEVNCSNNSFTNTTLRSGKSVQTNKSCDDKCDTEYCEDEAVCNGFIYGMYCKKTYYHTGRVNDNHYIPISWICQDSVYCDAGEDQTNCTAQLSGLDNTCERTRWTRWGMIKRPVPVHNFTRCGVLNGDLRGSNKYCLELKYSQTNCTDPARIGLKCLVEGYLSSVSKYAICYDMSITICDDHIEKQCSDPSKLCTNIHKHLLCDKGEDCQDGSDERDPSCRVQTERTCKRRVGNAGQLTLPLSWIGDGVEDCVDGIDETRLAHLWKR